MSSTGLIVRTVTIALAGLSATACSTLTRGGNQTLSFKADTPGATLYVDDKTVALPAKVKLSRKHSHTILVTAPDRQSVQFTMAPKFDGLSLGNLIYPGGSLGMLTDFLTGADKSFTSVDTIKLPHANPEVPTEPTLVLLHQHKSQLLTRDELNALKAAQSAEVAADTKPASDDETSKAQIGG
jgi:hypothetical protein